MAKTVPRLTDRDWMVQRAIGLRVLGGGWGDVFNYGDGDGYGSGRGSGRGSGDGYDYGDGFGDGYGDGYGDEKAAGGGKGQRL